MRACGLTRRRAQAAPGNYPATLVPRGPRAAARSAGRPVVRRRGRRVKSRRRARAGNPEGEWRGTAATGCRPSVRPSHQSVSIQPPREAETIAIVAPAALPPFRVGVRVSFLLSPPRPSPARGSRSGRRRGLLAAAGSGRPARARGVRPVPRYRNALSRHCVLLFCILFHACALIGGLFRVA